MSADELLDPTARAIVAECGDIADLLVAKNRQYGNSALEPVRLFSRADAVEQLLVRIDDKLSRIRSAQADDTEDAELDLLGYLVLLRIARKRAGATDKGGLTVAAAENSYLDKSSRSTLPEEYLGALCGRQSVELEGVYFYGGKHA